ncbi:MAG: anion transporter [Myxococcales bacterium]
MPTLDELLRTQRTIVCVGSGGVGKTTTSAALALRAARQGRKVLVLTVDPARRLANSLGMRELLKEETRVSPELFAEAGIPCTGELWAMMLDTKSTFDGLIQRHAPDPVTRDRILSSPYYRQLSTALAGSQEYMAMEKLYEIRGQGKYDLIILDTPPTDHALDFLDAPNRMEDLIGSASFRLMMQGARVAGRAGLGFLRFNTLILKGVGKFVGADTFLSILDFLTSFGEMTTGFKERAAEVKKIFRSPGVSFVVLSGPDPYTIDEGLFFARTLQAERMPLGAFVVNRVRKRFLPQDLPNDIEARVATAMLDVQALQIHSEQIVRRISQKLVSAWRNHRTLVGADAAQVERLRAALGSPTLVHTVPYFPHDVHDIGGLHTFETHLMSA